MCFYFSFILFASFSSFTLHSPTFLISPLHLLLISRKYSKTFCRTEAAAYILKKTFLRNAFEGIHFIVKFQG